jgi:hypothetical protein
MTPQVQAWVPAGLALFGSLIVVGFTAWLNTRVVIAHVDALRTEMGALRAEMKQSMNDREVHLNPVIWNRTGFSGRFSF